VKNTEVLRKVISILDTYTTKVENNVRFGSYPFIAYYEGNMRIFKMMGDRALSSLTGWLLPVGIPFMAKHLQKEDEEEEADADRVRVIGYYLGNALYIHENIYGAYVGGAEDKVFFTPEIEDVIHLAPGGWGIEEQKNFTKYLWQMATKSMSGDFREIADINFEASLNIKRDVLFRDGWVTNRVAGRNIFYGIMECPIEQYDIEVDTEGKHFWYNKYLTILDVTGGNGIQTFGIVAYEGNYHPHVSGEGGLCKGNATKMIQDRLNAGLLTEFFIFMKDFLSHYYSDNPFVKMPVHSPTEESPLVGSKHIIEKIYHSDTRYDDSDD